jgi:beta-mannosidase
VVHDPLWKARVPRDTGASWDFEDVRDHYLQLLFGVDPVRLRHTDVEHYLALSRLTTGEAMASVVGQWRRLGSDCHGGLVWFLRDLWPGAGWGVIDAGGTPKAAYYYLKRQFRSLAVFLVDDGLNGLALHVVNETAAEVPVEVHLALYRDGETTVASASMDTLLPARGGVRLDTEALLGRFVDATYAYRFRPPGHDLVVAEVRDPITRQRLANAFYFPLGLPSAVEADIGLAAQLEELDDQRWAVHISTQRFALGVSIDAPSWRPEDNYFHLAPNSSTTVMLHPCGRDVRMRGTVRASNARATAALRLGRSN